MILTGRQVRLQLLSIDDLDGSCEIGLDAELWRWTPYWVRSRDDMRRYIEAALRDQAEGRALPFTTIEHPTERAIGCTSYMNIDLINRHVEIGPTWIGREWQRTPVNTEAKYLMLLYAFETLACLRVELKTDVLNEKSRNAILRIGATQEGIFRKHVVCWDGRIRDTVWYSILDSRLAGSKGDAGTKMRLC